MGADAADDVLGALEAAHDGGGAAVVEQAGVGVEGQALLGVGASVLVGGDGRAIDAVQQHGLKHLLRLQAEAVCGSCTQPSAVAIQQAGTRKYAQEIGLLSVSADSSAHGKADHASWQSITHGLSAGRMCEEQTAR